MNDRGLQRISGVAGIVFGVLVALTLVTLADSPGFADDAAKINRYFVENDAKIILAAVFSMVAAFALAWFGHGVRIRFDAGGTAGGSSPVALGVAIAASSYAIGGAILAVGAARADEQGDAAAASSFLNFDLFLTTFAAAAPMGLAVLLSGVAWTALRRRTWMPRWLAWLSVILAAVGLVPAISFMLTFGIVAWSVIVGVLMFRRDPSAAA